MKSQDIKGVIVTTGGGYPDVPPFHPGVAYPEYEGPISERPNYAYDGVRKVFADMGLDADNFGSSAWNPLGTMIHPGQDVFIKPNLASHEYGRKKEKLSGDVFSVITHPSVVRAVADYAALALKGEGSITIGDNPTLDADFAVMKEVTGLHDVAEFCAQRFGISCKLLDLRGEWCSDIRYYGLRSCMTSLPGDPRGMEVVNLGRRSYLAGLNPLLFRGVFSNRFETMRHHHGRIHRYGVSKSIYDSDVFISLPKLKSHHKVGATLNVKGLVGMCAKKNYLVHWRIGYPSWGGDEYQEPERLAHHFDLMWRHMISTFGINTLWAKSHGRIAKWLRARTAFPGYRGAWEGNDTCWRMAADLYNVLVSRKRQTFSLVDGIVGGDGNGPFCTGRKPCHVLLASSDLLVADAMAVRLMDYRMEHIKYLKALLNEHDIDLSRVPVVGCGMDTKEFWSEDEPRHFCFRPPDNWPTLAIPKG